MSILRHTLIAAWLAGSMALSALPALADGVVHQHCCGWLPGGLFGGYYTAPAYFAGPLSGATFEYYYGSYWSRHYKRYQRVRIVK